MELTGKTSKELAQLKSIELAKLKLPKFKQDDFDIEIIGEIKEIEVNGLNGIELYAKVNKGKKQVGFGKDGTIEIERFRFFNPPVLVDDENGDIIRETIDERTKEKLVRKLKYDPSEALKRILVHTISLVAKDDKNIVKGKVGRTTTTFYPDAGTGSTTVDGRAYYYDVAGGTWATARGAAGTGATTASATIKIFGIFADTNSNEFDELQRFIATLNTAAINTDEISAATFSIKTATSAVTDDFGSSAVGLVSSNPASNNDLVAGDYDSLGTTRFATDITLASMSDSTYFDFTLNATGIAAINKTGITKLGCRMKRDIDNTAPTWGSDEESSVKCYQADEAGTASDPKLVVTHAPGDITKQISETFALTEIKTQSITRQIAETLNLSETYSGIKSIVKAISETIGLTETRVQSITRLLSESFTLLDTKTKSITRKLAEVFGLSEDADKTGVKSPKETITIKEKIVKLLNGNSTFWTNNTKPSDSWTEDSKPSDSWTNDDK